MRPIAMSNLLNGRGRSGKAGENLAAEGAAAGFDLEELAKSVQMKLS
jgi:hypothetical protein